MSTLKTGALRGTSGTADSVQLHASNQSVTFPGAVTCSGDVTCSGNIVIATAGKGIDFSATGDGANKSAQGFTEILDDFEEGQFIYTLDGSSGGGRAPRDGYTELFYQKIGNWCTIAGYVEWDGDVGSPSGDFRLGNLPFATRGNYTETDGSAGTTRIGGFAGMMRNSAESANNVAYWLNQTNGSQNYLQFVKWLGGTNNWSNVSTTDASSDGETWIYVHYPTA